MSDKARKLKELWRKGDKKKFKSIFKKYSQTEKNEIFAELVYQCTDDDLEAIQFALKLGAKPTKYFCKAHIQIQNKRYKILVLLMKNGLNFYEAYPLEIACKNNLPKEYMLQLVDAGGSFHPKYGSPLFFAVAQKNYDLIKWLLQVQKCDIHSTPSSYYKYNSNDFKYDSKTGFPAIAACIEMLKERWRDWYADRNPIDTTPQIRRWGLSNDNNKDKKVQKEKPKIWDLETDVIWIELCDLLKLLVSFGGNPFDNFTVKRRLGGQSRSPTVLLTWNVILFYKTYTLQSVKKALIDGYKNRIEKKAMIVYDVVTHIVDMNVCEVIGLYVIGDYNDNLRIQNEEMFKDDDYPIKTYSYNKNGDHFPKRTSGSYVRSEYPKESGYCSSFQ